MRSLSSAAVLVVLSLSAALAGCNSLTEPSEFKVVKEVPKQQAAAPADKQPADKQPSDNASQARGPGAAAAANLQPKPAQGMGDNARALNERVKAPAPAPAPQAGSCGE